MGGMALPGLKIARLARGLSQGALAELLEVEQPTVQRWETGKREPDNETIRRLAATLQTTVAELIGETDGRALELEGRMFEVSADTLPPAQLMPLDIPVYGTALGAPLSVVASIGDGETMAIEQATLNLAQVVDYVRRTPALVGRKNVYGVYVTGSSMSPRFHEAEVVLVDPHRPPAIGDDVIVQLRGANGHDGEDVLAVLVKRLVRRNSEYVELEQFNPATTFKVAMSAVKSVHRIIPLQELIGM